MKKTIGLKVNNEFYELSVEPQRTLAQVLREDLQLTGTKVGCNVGDCGACTVLIDGVAVSSCLTLATEAQGRDILTIEGLGEKGELDPLQQAFVEKGAVQCGFCTPGMILSAKGLLLENPTPTGQEIKEAIGGTLCRCTGYVKIVDAIQAASAIASSQAGQACHPERREVRHET